jgi:AcrR family transcriptional regulator
MPACQLRPLERTRHDAIWERLRRAVVDLVCERGDAALEVGEIVERAGVGRADFERRFADAGDCCTQVYEADIADFDRIVLSAYLRHPAWRDGIRAAAYAAVGYLQENPRRARFDAVQVREGGAMAQVARDRYMQRIVDLVDAGRQEMADPSSLSRAAAEAVLGAIYVFMRRRMGSDRSAGLAAEMVPQLMYMAVRPYLGHEVALEELAIRPPPEEGGAR